jgi:murein peptide amidase A
MPAMSGRQQRARQTFVSLSGTKVCRAIVVLTVLVLAVLASEASASERTVIGHSVEGRPIVVVHSGPADPALKVLVVGDIHGNETAGMPVVRRLLRQGAPAAAGLWLVPTINPDGVAADTRGNAHGVDLNRNFAYDWAPLTGGEYSGTGPLSEPESRAAQRLIRRVKPDVTIWFHQPFGIVDRPPGNPFVARRYSRLSGLPMVTLPGRYPGSASRWQNYTYPHSTAFVVELPTYVSGALSRRATAALHSLAAELASPGLSSAGAAGDQA